MSAASDFARLQRLPPQEAIAYMQGRELVGETFNAYDLWHSEHGRAFTISRLARADLLEALQQSLAKSVAGDLTRRDWINSAEQLLKDAGWWGVKEVIDPRTGEVLKTRFNHARLQLIFDTNVRQAAAAGQWQRMLRHKRTHPYVRYVSMDDERTRELHRRWHNVTLPIEHPWWETHRPPNGWRCRCRVIGVTQAEYDRGTTQSRPGAATNADAPLIEEPLKKQAPEQPTRAWRNPATGQVHHIPVGIDPGFDYNAGTQGRSQAFEALVRGKLARLSPAVRQAALGAGLWPPVASLATHTAPLSWEQRQQALGFPTGKGWELQAHEVEFYERFAALGQQAQLIARSDERLPSNDFLWLDMGIEIEVKKPKKAAYGPAHQLIRDAVNRARSNHGFTKDSFIIDLGDKSLSDKLRSQLAQYNNRNPDNQIRALWVLSKGQLIEIVLNRQKEV